MSTYLGSPEKVARVNARMAAKRQDAAVRRHFAATPLYLAAMISTGIRPRDVYVETEEFMSIAHRHVRWNHLVVEGDLHPDEGGE